MPSTAVDRRARTTKKTDTMLDFMELLTWWEARESGE